MPNDEKLLLFYEEMVNELQLDKEVARIFYTEALIILLLNSSRDHSIRLYEYLLQVNLAYKGRDNITASPFERLSSEYYEGLLTDELLKYESEIYSKLNINLHHRHDDITLSLLNIKDPEIIKKYDIIYKLDTVIRKGWIKRNVSTDYQESDMTHTVQMFAFACAFYHANNLDLDLLRIYEMILVHDIGEIIIGDDCEGTEEHLTKPERERKAIIKIFSKLSNGEYYISLWEEFEARETKEAKFVYCLDKLDPILKAKYLDKELGRDDLFDDFYDYEEKRHTFDESPLKSLFYSLKNQKNT